MSNNTEDLSRRDMIRWSAVVSGGAAVAACNGGTTTPDTGVDAGTDVATDTPADAGSNAATVTLLNALLSAEWGAIAAYTAGAGILSSPPAGDILATQAPVILAVAVHFQSQHMAHAAALMTAVTSLGGTPVAQSSVTFTAPAGFTPGVLNVMKLACNAEKAAAVAYNGTVPQLPAMSSAPTNLRFLAGSILGDETQHFTVLYALILQIAGPGPMLTTMTSAIAPTDFTSTVGTDMGLESVADYTYT